ncbi:CsbD family protein [Micromonospora sp. LZ34]
MGFTDKAKSKVEQLTGAAKERMRQEGASQQGEARPRQAGEPAKEAGRNVRDPFTR